MFITRFENAVQILNRLMRYTCAVSHPETPSVAIAVHRPRD